MPAKKVRERPPAQPKSEEDVQAEVEAPPEPPETPAEPALDAVLVIKEAGEDGAINVRVLPNGNVQITEIETLLKLGLKKWLNDIGLT